MEGKCMKNTRHTLYIYNVYHTQVVHTLEGSKFSVGKALRAPIYCICIVYDTCMSMNDWKRVNKTCA